MQSNNLRISFSRIFRDELTRLSLTQAGSKVKIHNADCLREARKEKIGGVVLFLHFGNFFLSGAALIAKLKLKYTAIASTENFTAMEPAESSYWRKIHRLANKTYSRAMFLSNKAKIEETIDFLKSGNFLGAALDVAEIGRRHKFHPFQFLHNRIFLQTGPARLARIAKVPIYGMTMAYDRRTKSHNLHLSGPFPSSEVMDSVQKVLLQMETHVEKNTDQLFHDVFSLFSERAIGNHRIRARKPLPPPVPQINSTLPANFFPRYESNVTSWHPHRDFAYELIRSHKPKLIVELGVHYGDSFFTFCQACEELDLETKLFGIDHWEGDAQSGLYGEEVFEEVNAYNEEFHSENSTLLKMNFEAALDQFEDQSIDLLHIDGSHEYESIRRDFENWLPKVKKGGRILIHDVLVEREDFGVKKFWEEISKIYRTESHELGYGLGVLER